MNLYTQAELAALLTHLAAHILAGEIIEGEITFHPDPDTGKQEVTAVLRTEHGLRYLGDQPQEETT